MFPISLLSALKDKILLCDGATGTQLQKLGLGFGACGELWNLEEPERIRTVHRLYAEAGSDLLTTNTFGGTRIALARHGLEGRQREINVAGARLAREIAGEHRYVLGDMGPCGDLLDPYGDVQPEALFEDFKAQAEALLEGGADALLVETMSDPAEAAIAVKAARAAGAKVILATYSFQKTPAGFKTMMGSDVRTALGAAIEAGADIVGSNCGTSLSLEDYEALAVDLVSAAQKHPVILQPNAGSPLLVEGKAVYNETPAQMAEHVPALLASGLRIIGGCCGTGPGHISALRAKLGK
jgi:5-methyltetrahydrofolate--homocysteine methyltransferase